MFCLSSSLANEPGTCLLAALDVLSAQDRIELLDSEEGFGCSNPLVLKHCVQVTNIRLPETLVWRAIES